MTIIHKIEPMTPAEEAKYKSTQISFGEFLRELRNAEGSRLPTTKVTLPLEYITLLKRHLEKNLRDQFAMAALTGLASDPTVEYHKLAERSWVVADSMIAQRDE